jgi:hypothetical protein
LREVTSAWLQVGFPESESYEKRKEEREEADLSMTMTKMDNFSDQI